MEVFTCSRFVFLFVKNVMIIKERTTTKHYSIYFCDYCIKVAFCSFNIVMSIVKSLCNIALRL